MHSSDNPLQIYCDLDDVLTNFEESASQAIGVPLNRVSATILWDCLKKKFLFFETLPWKKGTCERKGEKEGEGGRSNYLYKCEKQLELF